MESAYRQNIRKEKNGMKKCAIIIVTCIATVLFVNGNSHVSKYGIEERPYAELKKELVIGESTNESNYIFAGIRSVQVDDLSNIYVLDRKDHKIHVFDKSGHSIVTYGKEGQGPGELQSPLKIFLNDEYLNVFDFGNKRISVYSLSGKFIRDKYLGKLGNLFVPEAIAGKSIYGNTIEMRADGSQILKLVKYNSDANELLEISREKKDDLYPKYNPLSDTYILRTRKDSTFVWCYTRNYEIVIMSPEAEIIRRIKRKYDPLKINNEDKEILVNEIYGKKSNLLNDDSVVWSKYYSPIRNILTDEKGWIYAKIYENDKSLKNKYAIFDNVGNYRGYFIPPSSGNIEVIKNDAAFCSDEDSNGMPIIIRYKIIRIGDIDR